MSFVTIYRIVMQMSNLGVLVSIQCWQAVSLGPWTLQIISTGHVYQFTQHNIIILFQDQYTLDVPMVSTAN